MNERRRGSTRRALPPRRGRGRGRAGRDDLAGGAPARRRFAASVLESGAGLPRRRQLPRLHGRDRGRARARRLVHPQARVRHEGAVRRASGRRSRASWCSSYCSPTSPSAKSAHDPGSRFWRWADKVGIGESRFPPREHMPAPDRSHPAMAVHLDACIECTLCVRACREVQVNDVIGMAKRGPNEKIVFDFDDPMGGSTCVACGECVQACPTGALMPAAVLDAHGVYAHTPDRSVDSVCPYCGVGCQITYRIEKDKLLYVDGKTGPSNLNRLCVKGRFGFDYVHHRDRLTVPLIRKDGVAEARRRPGRSGQSLDPFPRGVVGGGARARGRGVKAHARHAWRRGARRVRLGQGLERGGLSLPEAGAHWLRHQQCRSLHAALPCLLGRGADGGDRLGRGDGALHGRRGCRGHHRHRRQSDREPSGRRDLLQERGAGRQDADRDGPARPGAQAARDPHAAIQAEPRRGVAVGAAQRHHRRGHGRPAICPGAHRGFRGARRERQGPHTRADGRGVRHRRRDPAHRRAQIRPRRGLDHLLGHGHLAIDPRHRQCALPHRAGAGHGTDRAARHRAPSAARPEQCAGRIGCGPDPDVLSRLPAGRSGRGAAVLRRALGPGARPQPRPHRRRDHERDL